METQTFTKQEPFSLNQPILDLPVGFLPGQNHIQLRQDFVAFVQFDHVLLLVLRLYKMQELFVSHDGSRRSHAGLGVQLQHEFVRLGIDHLFADGKVWDLRDGYGQ